MPLRGPAMPRSLLYASLVAGDAEQRMLATGLAMGAASVMRTGIGCLQLWSERLTPLLQRAGDGREGQAKSSRSEAQFRDELIAIARESSEIARRELWRGLYDLDTFTRPDESPADQSARPYKAKR
jgi:hypothetical protein